MKTRQIVPKKLALAVLAVMFLCMLSITIAKAQTTPYSKPTVSQARQHSKLQKSVEWQNYQANWKKIELQKAKEIRKINKEQDKEAKDRQRFFAKLERIRQ